MNKERVRKLLERMKSIKKMNLRNFKDNEIIIKNKKEEIQALDIAIESLKENHYLVSRLKLEQTKLEIYKKSRNNEWVDVRYRLPSEEKWVLVSLARGGIDVLRLVNIEKFEKERNGKISNAENFIYFWDKQTYWFKFNEIIAWKPLPKPYEREGVSMSKIELSPPTIEQVIAWVETVKEDMDRKLDKTINILKGLAEDETKKV